MARRLKTIKVPATTANITKGIVNFLNSNGHYAFRVHTTGIWDPIKKVMRRTNGVKGCADIICCLHYQKAMINGPLTTNFNTGLFMAVEVKNQATGDTMSGEQEIFAGQIQRAGGLYVIASTVEGFVNWYHAQNIKPDESYLKALSGKSRDRDL